VSFGELPAVQVKLDAVQLAITNSAAAGPAGPLDPGYYRVSSTKACRFLQGGSSVALSDNSTKGNYLPANTFFPDVIKVTGATDAYFNARTAVASETGTLEITAVPSPRAS
jgi:hypothetical protein